MTPEAFVDIFRHALQVIVMMVSAIIVPGLVVGLIVAVFQAATSINEQTLSFLPRLLVTLVTMMFLGHWLVRTLMELMYEMVALIPQMVG
ncbi:flagellar biosynthetic protein FliQ [Ferrimonas balearica DSM 9799]|uniref:Flagellar biosynthetic protein FliQ n=1 Tax=Ferrimonas balearica (strain DSM 9799 / CCM 4581 / KCTC 23876 / PAT) TaxID=550540 RepID=E1SUR4_FERBD|nr:flagellar biosynthesis protein FliQ [Ferrimonas balearica]MBY6018250.1 flagellar biosynthesis protein FliQ [Halomonas denitrificans]ADN75255.1 flagellar biosynthetic protein FliQ [Ferrimonas balearica DSM 9799]MBW3138162.1 flagellar biosynthesis protein FliQ [Ferrimonas balearica]MBW3164283.1 flagellar biosynthesis protein FliQ [Ferrimonas balearica]MBY5978919.1 flagellar biosynthesis protein FliQ [Ferrimonas balearica]